MGKSRVSPLTKTSVISVGGIGGKSKLSSGSITISKTETKIETLTRKIEKLEKENTKLFDNTGGFIHGTESKEWKQWNENRQKIIQLEDDLLNTKIKLNELKEKPSETKKFVNSFGEATTRYITNGTYERVQKRTQTNVTNFLTNGKRK